jgi:hypothetical protein
MTGPGRLPPARALVLQTRDYWCGLLLLELFSIWPLQYFFTSLFDMLGWLASCWDMQSFICCECDLLVVLDDSVVVVVVLLLLG